MSAPITVTEHLRRRALMDSDERNPFALPSLNELSAPIVVEPIDIGERFALDCRDCGAEYLIGLESLAQYGAPHCSCGAGALRSDALEAMTEETSEGPKRLRVSDVIVRKPHPCGSCWSEIPAGESARYAVEVIDGELSPSYTCYRCAEGDRRHRGDYSEAWRDSVQGADRGIR